MQLDMSHADLAICWTAITITATQILQQWNWHVRWCMIDGGMDGWQFFWVMLWNLCSDLCLSSLCRDESIWSPGQKNGHWARLGGSFCRVSIAAPAIAVWPISVLTCRKGQACIMYECNYLASNVLDCKSLFHPPFFSISHANLCRRTLCACPSSLITS